MPAPGPSTQEQVEAWAGPLIIERGQQTIAATTVSVDVVDGSVVGFCTLVVASAEIGWRHLAPASGPRGAARELLEAVEEPAVERHMRALHTHASLRAEPVIERLAYQVGAPDEHHTNGQVFAEAHMAKSVW